MDGQSLAYKHGVTSSQKAIKIFSETSISLSILRMEWIDSLTYNHEVTSSQKAINICSQTTLSLSLSPSCAHVATLSHFEE